MRKIFYLMLITAIAFTACKKEDSKKRGCTDPSSENYCSDCNEDDGSCKYQGKLVFWWKQPFSDSCQANGVASINVYVNGANKGNIAVGSLYWTGAPACGAANTVTVTQDYGTAKSQTITVGYEGLDGSGTVITPLVDQNLSIGLNCNTHELTW